jgi:hypothetical protein
MTVAIPEAATAARAATAGRSASAGRAGAGRVVPPQRRAASRTSAARPLPAPPRRQSEPFSGGKQRARRDGPGLGERYRDARRRVPDTPVHRGNYQAVILAEFVAAVVLVALTPVASKKNPDGLSPYAGQDMVKLGAVTGTYFALALVSVGGQTAGRFAAWFGGLILLAVGLGEAANLAGIISLGGGGQAAAAAGPDSGTTQQGSTIAGRN